MCNIICVLYICNQWPRTGHWYLWLDQQNHRSQAKFKSSGFRNISEGDPIRSWHTIPHVTTADDWMRPSKQWPVPLLSINCSFFGWTGEDSDYTNLSVSHPWTYLRFISGHQQHHDAQKWCSEILNFWRMRWRSIFYQFITENTWKEAAEGCCLQETNQNSWSCSPWIEDQDKTGSRICYSRVVPRAIFQNRKMKHPLALNLPPCW